jgi:hypothetical protein
MDHDPAQRGKLHVFFAVTCDIAGEFVPPPIAVVLGKNAVFWTCMPEASVDKYGNPSARECNIWTARQLRVIQPESKPAAVQFSPNQNLRPRGGTGHPLHFRRNCRI